MEKELPYTARIKQTIHQRYALFTAEQRQLFPKIHTLRRNINRTNNELKKLVKSMSAK